MPHLFRLAGSRFPVLRIRLPATLQFWQTFTYRTVEQIQLDATSYTFGLTFHLILDNSGVRLVVGYLPSQR